MQNSRTVAISYMIIWVLSVALYWGTALFYGDTQSPDVAYFDQLAHAFLQGRLFLIDPPSVHDLTQYQLRWYVPFPPLPALLMLPWVAVAGLAQTNTVLFSCIMGALNVVCVYGILHTLSARGWTRLRRGGNLWLTLLFAAGCVHWYMAPDGAVWFVAQICTVTFAALSVWLALTHGSPWWAGGALALAMLSRPTIVLTGPLLLGIAATRFRNEDGRIDLSRLARWTVALGVFPLLAVVGLLLYNFARFDNPLDFGYLTENVAERLVDDLRTYGQFNVRYVPRNLWAMWLALPRQDPGTGTWQPDYDGLSLLITTPALVYLAGYRARAFFRRSWVVGAWVSLILLMVPLALYYNTGWGQFGYRFSLDFMVPVMVLLAVAAGDRVSWPLRILILLGVLVNAWGVHWWYM